MRRLGPFGMARLGSDSLLSKGLLLAGLAYPAWYLLTPDGAADSWPVYWTLAFLMMLPELLALLVPLSRPYTRSLCHLVLAALTGWAFWLAHANEMHPFYAVGSMAMGLNCAIALSSRSGFIAFSAWIVLLTGGSYLWSPDLLKVAYWGPLYVMLAFCYWQLRARLRAEAEVLRHQRDLERLVARRTKTLVQRTRDLAASNQRLERESAEREQAEARLRDWQKLEALGRLAGGVAHDFNNLLTVIGGMAENLRDRFPPGSPEHADTQEICRAAGRAADLIRNLLAFSRQDTFEVSRIDLNDALRDALPVLGVLMGEDVDVAVELAPEPAWIHTNGSQLHQLLVNLACNARDAMPEGGTLTLCTRVEGGGAQEAGERRVELSIRDTGVGMDEETLARIFDPFFTTKDVGKGTGLGLAAVHGFVEQTSGSIRVDSTPGSGTEFTIGWPYGVDRAEEAALRGPRPVAAGETAATRRRVLVVDDEPSLLRVVRRVLEDGGYEVREASGPEAALEALRNEGGDIDLLLTDVVMPRESGIELAEKVSKLRPELPIVFMSGYLDHPSLQSPELPGSAPLLCKPFPPAALLASLRDVFEGVPRSSRGPGAGPARTEGAWRGRPRFPVA